MHDTETAAPSSVPSTATATSGPDPSDTPDPPQDSHEGSPAGMGTERPSGIYNVVCDYVRTAAIDPIGMPGHVGMSMAHDFFGSRAVEPTSDGIDLLGTTTSCTSAKDPSSYWVPALYRNRIAVLPTKVKVYYETVPSTASQIRPYPPGLQILAGNKRGTAPRTDWTVWYSCAKGMKALVGPQQAVPTSCPQGTDFQINFRFPECWDGHTMAGADQRNVVYRGQAGCPADHPVVLARIVAHVHYPITGPLGDLRLAADHGATAGIHSAHLDFLNSWDELEQNRLITKCLHGQRKCGTVRDR